MNTRIQELLEQAGGGYFDEDGNALSAALIGKEVEKFALLLVRKCAGIADEPTSQPFSSYGEKIKEHFGVE